MVIKAGRLSAAQRSKLCENVAVSLGCRCSELDSAALLGALQVLLVHFLFVSKVLNRVVFLFHACEAFADLLGDEPFIWDLET